VKLAEQTMLITGGAAGIGRHLVETFAGEFAGVVVLDRDEAAISELHKTMPSVRCHVCDVADPAAVESTVSSIYEEGPVTVLVNNAGVIHSEPLLNLLSREDKKHRLETWKRTIDIDLNSVFYVTSCMAEHMLSRRLKGLIANVSSVAASGNAGQSAYSAAKAAVNALTVTWAKELGIFGIRVAGIAPGFFDAPSTRAALSQANLEKWMRAAPLGRLGTLDEIAGAMRFIFENDYFHGRTLELDGGLRL